MGIERHQRTRFVAVHRQQLGLLQRIEAHTPVVIRQPDQRFGKASDRGSIAQSGDAIGRRRTIKQPHQAEDRQLPLRLVAAVLHPFHLSGHRVKGMVVIGLLARLLELHAVTAANVTLMGLFQKRTHDVQRQGVAIHIFDKLFKLADLFALRISIDE